MAKRATKKKASKKKRTVRKKVPPSKKKRPRTQPSDVARGFGTDLVFAESEEELDRLGFLRVEAPDFTAKDILIRSDVTDMSPQVLGQYYSRYARLCEYIHTVLGDLEAHRVSADAAHVSVRADVLSQLKNDKEAKKLSVAERKALADAHPDTLAAYKAACKAEASLKKGTQMLEGYRIQLAALSREITRRERIVPLTELEAGMDRRGDHPSRRGGSRKNSSSRR